MGRLGLVGCFVCAAPVLVTACSTKDEDAAGDDARQGDADAATGTAGFEVIEFDARDGTATTEPDAIEDTVPPAAAGEPCDDGSQCASGWCVPSAIGVVCVDLCIDACPANHVCALASAQTATDPVFLCVPLSGPDDPDDPDGGADATSGDAGPDPTEDASDPDADPDATIDLDGVGPNDGTAGDGSDGGGVSDNDQDGDGIPDDEDNIPCLGFTLTVYNEGVTSGSLELNGQEVVSPSSFPTNDPIVVTLNPVVGENTLAITGKLGGSPSDSMTLVVMDSTGRLWFYVVVVRSPGPPREESFTFTIDVDCDALTPP